MEQTGSTHAVTVSDGCDVLFGTSKVKPKRLARAAKRGPSEAKCSVALRCDAKVPTLNGYVSCCYSAWCLECMMVYGAWQTVLV